MNFNPEQNCSNAALTGSTQASANRVSKVSKISKIFSCVILLVLLSFQTSANDRVNDWKPLTTIDGIEISYMKSTCGDSEVLFIKTRNTTDQSLTISLKYDFTMDGESVGSGVLAVNDLASQTETSGDCDSGLRINVYDHLSMFDESLVNLTITKNQD